MNNIAYSVLVDKKMEGNDSQPLRCTLPRRNYTWVDDDTVTKCYTCDKQFSMFIRRHHCRMCGKIFCYECSNYKQIIPETLASDKSSKQSITAYFSSYIISPSKDNTPERVCTGCNKLIQTINSVKRLTEVFKIAKLNVRQLKKAGSVCRTWNTASNYCLTLFREIQYKLPTDPFTEDERATLWLNSKYMPGHSRYLMALLKNCNSEREIRKVIKILGMPKKITCNSMMCTRSCQPKFTSTDAINLLAHCFRNLKFTDSYKKIALEYLVCSDKEFKCYITFLVYNLRYDNGVLSDWLVRRCINNFDLLTALYWEVGFYSDNNKIYNMTLTKIKQMLTLEQHTHKQEKLVHQRAFTKIVEELGDSIFENKQKYDQIKNRFNLKSPLECPLWPGVKINNLKLNKIQIKDSISKPMIVPCETPNRVLKLMYKKDNLRKDQIILNIINLMSILVKREEGIDLNIVDYKILPTAEKKGFVEIVDNAETIYFIQQKIKTSIINYILEQNEEAKIKDIKDKFIKSTAAYCVLTYLLGIGDRHLDNIMVTTDGRLFHIDFGYILGKDPAFSNPGIRITPEIIDAIGGFSSEYYVEFKNICTKIYNCMRRHIDIFMNMILILKKISNSNSLVKPDIKITEEQIKALLVKRFIPGENEIDAQLHLVSKLENSSYTDKIKDFCHYHSREKTFSGAIGRLSSAMSSLWTTKDTSEST